MKARVTLITLGVDDLEALGQRLEFDTANGLRGKIGANFGGRGDLGGGNWLTYFASTKLVSDFGGNAVFRFDPGGERFERFGFPRAGAAIRQILGRPGEVWLPESGTEHITVIRTA